MKRFTILIIGIITACNGNKRLQSQNITPKNSQLVTTTLSDSLGTVTLYVPNSYDTFFKWTNWSDCGKPCAHDEYRFQSKSLPIKMESGWLWLGEPKDSIERFTIVHSSYFPFY